MNTGKGQRSEKEIDNFYFEKEFIPESKATFFTHKVSIVRKKKNEQPWILKVVDCETNARREVLVGELFRVLCFDSSLISFQPKTRFSHHRKSNSYLVLSKQVENFTSSFSKLSDYKQVAYDLVKLLIPSLFLEEADLNLNNIGITGNNCESYVPVKLDGGLALRGNKQPSVKDILNPFYPADQFKPYHWLSLIFAGCTQPVLESLLMLLTNCEKEKKLKSSIINFISFKTSIENILNESVGYPVAYALFKYLPFAVNLFKDKVSLSDSNIFSDEKAKTTYQRLISNEIIKNKEFINYLIALRDSVYIDSENMTYIKKIYEATDARLFDFKKLFSNITIDQVKLQWNNLAHLIDYSSKLVQQTVIKDAIYTSLMRIGLLTDSFFIHFVKHYINDNGLANKTISELIQQRNHFYTLTQQISEFQTFLQTEIAIKEKELFVNYLKSFKKTSKNSIPNYIIQEIITTKPFQLGIRDPFYAKKTLPQNFINNKRKKENDDSLTPPLSLRKMN